MYELEAKNSVQKITYRAGNIGRVYRKMKELKAKDFNFNTYVIKRNGKIILNEKIKDKPTARYFPKR